MEVREELVQTRLDVMGTEVTLQLCAWHAVEIIQARFTRKGYSQKKRGDIHHLCWSWVKTKELDDLSNTREAVLALLHENEKAYLVSYYQRPELAFVTCYTKMYPNLGAISTQSSEGTHPGTKVHVNRHTTMRQLISRLKENVERQEFDYIRRINRQKTTTPVLMDLQAVTWKEIGFKITHEAIDLLIEEWARMLKWLEEDDFEDPEGDKDKCLLRCSLPRQFGLPCKCFLYR